MNNILEIKNLKKIYHNTKGETLAIENISFDVKQGDFISVVGPSGCGKSTLLSILCGLDNYTDGEIKYDNSINIGYMLQQDCLFDWLTILENCMLGLTIKKKNNRLNKDKVLHLLKIYGLESFINSYPNSLSGGMRQRVV